MSALNSSMKAANMVCLLRYSLRAQNDAKTFLEERDALYKRQGAGNSGGAVYTNILAKLYDEVSGGADVVVSFANNEMLSLGTGKVFLAYKDPKEK